MPSEAHDWQPVIDRIGTHPDLQLRDGVWWVRYMAPGYGTIHATPATVDALMLAHCTAWLDERCVVVRQYGEDADGEPMFCIDRDQLCPPVVRRALRDVVKECFADHLSATIAAVAAAAGERGAEG